MQWLIRSAFVVLFVLAPVMSAAVAEMRYVTDGFEIMLRTGPDTTNKIIAQIRSGQKVEIITPGEDWSEVIAPNGKQGWVLSRFLTKSPPPSVMIEQVNQRHNALLSENEKLRQEVAVLKEQSTKLGIDLESSRAELSSLAAAHETLKKDSADVLLIKEEHQRAIGDMEALRTRAEQAEADLKTSGERNKGLLYGGVLLVFGFVTGYIMKRPKRRVPLML